MKIIRKMKDIIIKTHLFNLVTARLHQHKRIKELKQLLGDSLDKYRNMPMESVTAEESDYVWVCWWQGESNMTPIVKKCYQRICENNKNKKIVLITEENVKDWVEFPNYIWEKYKKDIITKTHFSDLLRTALLEKWGGIWMDITLLTFSEVPKQYYEYAVYTGRYVYNKHDYNISKNRWTSFFWVARYPGNILFKYMKEFWEIYWKEKDELIEYFLIDYALDLGYRHIHAIKKELDLVPINGCGRDVWELLKVLALPYDEKILNDIESNNWMQKLTYKVEASIQNNSINPENSIYKKLFLEQTEERNE